MRRSRGFSIVELTVAMSLGLLLTAAAGGVYVSTKGSFQRQEQLSAVQQNIRMAFEYLASDARMAGHMGCFTGQDSDPSPNDFDGGWADVVEKFKTNYLVGIEGFEYNVAGSYTVSSATPANSSTAADWRTNVDARGTATIPIAAIAGSATGDGLTPGSDVLVIRTIAGKALRMTAPSAAGNSLSVETVAGGKCPDNTDKLSGLCANSHAMVANCTRARMFPVAAISAGSITVPGSAFIGSQYLPENSEVMPLQTIVYYLKQASSGDGTSLYRRVFDGTVPAGIESELVSGVETMQVRYGRDTTLPTPDGTVDDYVTADEVGDWRRVVTARMSLVLRSPEKLPPGLSMRPSDPVNGITIVYPDTRYDRRVFTTTVAVRNKTSYF